MPHICSAAAHMRICKLGKAAANRRVGGLEPAKACRRGEVRCRAHKPGAPGAGGVGARPPGGAAGRGAGGWGAMPGPPPVPTHGAPPAPMQFAPPTASPPPVAPVSSWRATGMPELGNYVAIHDCAVRRAGRLRLRLVGRAPHGYVGAPRQRPPRLLTSRARLLQRGGRWGSPVTRVTATGKAGWRREKTSRRVVHASSLSLPRALACWACLLTAAGTAGTTALARALPGARAPEHACVTRRCAALLVLVLVLVLPRSRRWWTTLRWATGFGSSAAG